VAGQRFVKYWLHGAHLLVDGKKMAKSLGNFFTLRDLTNRGFTGRDVRFLLLKAHYRETFNFTLDGLGEARSALARLDDCVTKLKEVADGSAAAADGALLEAFTRAMDADLNVSAGWAVIFEWVREMNRLLAAGQCSAAQAAAALGAWERIDSVFGVGRQAETGAPPEILALLDQREAARKARDFKRADALRGELKARGWLIEDTPKGPRLKRG
jgi:cysteinyl-tRNA synthetase